MKMKEKTVSQLANKGKYDVKTDLQNLQMSVRVSQMMIQQLMQNMKSMSDDLTKTINHVYALQYKYLAMLRYLKLDTAELYKIANEQCLKDFEEAAAKADVEEGLETADVATADSTVIITSVAKDESGTDKGIFRSRIKLSESGVPDLISKLTGKKVGDKVTVKLNNLDHEVELLSIKNPKAAAQTAETTH